VIATQAAAQPGGARQVRLAGLEHDGLVERPAGVSVALAQEHAQPGALFR
jgi:hypothetical protein